MTGNYEWVALLKDPEKFIDAIGKDPEVIFNDPNIQIAIRMLRRGCQFGSPEIANFSKKLLKDAKLSAFIPNLPKRRPANEYLRFLKEAPGSLIQSIAAIEDHLSNYMKKSYKGGTKEYTTDKAKKMDIKKAFEALYDRSLSESELNEITGGERTRSRTTIALSFFSFVNDLPYDTLYDYYHDLKRVYTKQEIERILKDKKVGKTLAQYIQYLLAFHSLGML
jgi:hypothetical protein